MQLDLPARSMLDGQHGSHSDNQQHQRNECREYNERVLHGGKTMTSRRSSSKRTSTREKRRAQE